VPDSDVGTTIISSRSLITYWSGVPTRIINALDEQRLPAVVEGIDTSLPELRH